MLGEIQKFPIKAWIPWFSKTKVVPIPAHACPGIWLLYKPTASLRQQLYFARVHHILLFYLWEMATHREWIHTFWSTAANIWVAGAASSNKPPMRSSSPFQCSTHLFLSWNLSISLPSTSKHLESSFSYSETLHSVIKTHGCQPTSSPVHYELLIDPLGNASRNLFSFS